MQIISHSNKQFYNEALIFTSYPIDEILGIFDIDDPSSCQSSK